MEEIVKILMKRDGMSRLEAENLLDETKARIQSVIDEQAGENAFTTLLEIEDIILDDLGLEGDYIDQLIF